MTSLKVLVTGGSGFLGSHVADALTRAGHAVTIFDRVESPFLNRAERLKDKPAQKMVVGDLLDGDALAELVPKFDVVYHLAALADLNAAKSQPEETVALNIQATVRLLSAAQRSKLKRFVFASSVYVYSREGSFYRCSKQACENYIEEFQRSYGLPYTIVRYGSLYGPRSDSTNGVYRLLEQAIVDGRIAYSGAESDMREYIHVEDAAKLSVQALDEDFENAHLVLTGTNQTRVSDLFTMFSEMLGRKIEIDYACEPGEISDGHYSMTPYAYTPRPGLKVTSPAYIDMGQGLLRVIESIDRHRHEDSSKDIK